MTVVLLWTGCESEDVNVPKQKVSFPLSICLPAEETGMMINGTGPRKVMGDPGTTEQFALPNYIYILIMKQKPDKSWELWQAITRTPATSGGWTKKRYVGLLPTTGDSIYQYNEEFDLLLENGKFNGRVYAIASAVELDFNKDLDGSGITSLADAENLKFNSGLVQANIQDIYSTPCNFIPDTAYYGSFSSVYAKVPHLNLMLYHVAAKVDITWSVADSARVKAAGVNPIRLTHMDACNLFNDSAFCFKPMKNVETSKVTTTDSVHIVTRTDEGLWWEGRSYFYTIPYTTTGKAGYFPLQMKMATNDSTKYCCPTIYLNVENDTTFVPWLRATFNVKKPLTATTPEITVD